jgi:uncharacterized SAM-binding protein YcdF (DUF218 family)
VFLVMLPIGLWVAMALAVVVWGRLDNAKPSSAIVVLGAAQYEGRPSPVLRARLDHALDLWRKGVAPRVILTGGRGERDTTSEAEVGRRYAMRNGVPDSAIALETEGRTTSESLRAVSKMMEHESDKSVVLVSDPFHMLRLAILAQRLGLKAHTSPTRTSPISANAAESIRYVFGESVKVPLAFVLEKKPQ